MSEIIADALKDRFVNGVQPQEPPPVDISRVIVVVAETLPDTEVVSVDATVRHTDNTGAQS